MKEAAIVASKVQFKQQVMVDEKPVEDPKVSSGDASTYQDKL